MVVASETICGVVFASETERGEFDGLVYQIAEAYERDDVENANKLEEKLDVWLLRHPRVRELYLDVLVVWAKAERDKFLEICNKKGENTMGRGIGYE